MLFADSMAFIAFGMLGAFIVMGIACYAYDFVVRLMK